MKFKGEIIKCIEGDRKSQKAFYQHYLPLIKNIAYRYAKRKSDVFDIIQDSFISIFKGLNQFDANKGSLVAWMSKVTINESLKYIRKNKIVFDSLDGVDESSQDLSLLEELESKDLMKLIEMLPSNFQFVFMMKVVDGFSHREISEMLSIGESSSRTTLTRAKKKLQVLVKKHYQFN